MKSIGDPFMVLLMVLLTAGIYLAYIMFRRPVIG